MNKLIIIGNGFDLHHGLPTSYGSFIRWQIRKILEDLMDNKDCKSELIHIEMGQPGIVYTYERCENLENIVDLLTRPGNFSESTEKPSNIVVYNTKQYNFKITSKSTLYKRILSKHSEVNWVDIEMEYFKLLTEILQLMHQGRHKEQNALDQLKQLNYDLDQTITEFTIYLKEITKNAKANKSFENYASDPIPIQNINDENHYKKLENEDFIDEDRKYINPKSILFLNFNYTRLPHSLYDRYNKFQHIDIHGTIFDRYRLPVFGYGDEVGEEYAQIENTNNNDFLRFVKAFAYPQNSNYTDLLRFINSDSYIVYLWGHSCGLSDRTLLNMIFEHDNCAAIQPFYWKKPNETDNYTEIIHNLSRHFKNKQKFRSRVVNKELCREL